MMTLSKTVELLESRGLDFKGFWCLSCSWDGKPTVIYNYRRNHLVKVHQLFNECLPKESELEQKSPIDADRFLILVSGKDIVCPFCPDTLMKYTTVDSSDFVMSSCQNKECKYIKKHNSHFHVAELMQNVKRKQYLCLKHHYNSSIGGCFLCQSARDFNKNVAPKINAIFNKILKD